MGKAMPVAPVDAVVMRGNNCEPIDREWVEHAGAMANGEVQVRPVAINDFYDGIEIWRCDPCEGETKPDGILAVYWFPITKGDVRSLCAALGVPCNA